MSEAAEQHSTLDSLLRSAGADWGAAEAHGAFCGRACLRGVAAIPEWLEELRPRSHGQVVGIDSAAQQALQATVARSLLQLEAGQMQFEPVLPADDVPIAQRVIALAEWCHGFLQGLALAGAADTGGAQDALAQGHSQEILQDLAEISRQQGSVDGSEADEHAYMELVEYIRVSVQLVYDEMQPMRPIRVGGVASA